MKKQAEEQYNATSQMAWLGSPTPNPWPNPHTSPNLPLALTLTLNQRPWGT